MHHSLRIKHFKNFLLGEHVGTFKGDLLCYLIYFTFPLVCNIAVCTSKQSDP